MDFSKNGADQADNCRPVGKNADDIGATANFLIQTLQGIVRPDLLPMFLWKGRERQKVMTGFLKKVCSFRKSSLELIDHSLQLFLSCLGIGLSEYRAHECGDQILRRSGNLTQEISHEVRSTPLPGCSRKSGRYSISESLMSVRDDQPDAMQTSSDQASQEGQPSGAIFRRHHIQPQNRSLPLFGHSSGYQDGYIGNAPALPAFFHQGIEPDISMRHLIQRPIAKLLHQHIKILSHGRHLRLGNACKTKRLDQPFHASGGDSKNIGFCDDTCQRLLSPAARLEEPLREITSLPQFGNRQVDRPDPGIPSPMPISVPRIGSLIKPLPILAATDRVCLRAHQHGGHGGQHLTHQVRVSFQSLAQPLQGVYPCHSHRGLLSNLASTPILSEIAVALFRAVFQKPSYTTSMDSNSDFVHPGNAAQNEITCMHPEDFF